MSQAASGPAAKAEKPVTERAKRYNTRSGRTHDEKKQRVGLTGPSTRPAACVQKAVAEQHVTQEHAVQKAGTGERCGQISAELAKFLSYPPAAHVLGSTLCAYSSGVSASGNPHAKASSSGSTIADRTRRAYEVVGKTPLPEIAEKYPEDALRVYISDNFKPYNDESPEFSEKLKIFERNCEITRTRNAMEVNEGRKPILGLNLMADERIIGQGTAGEQRDRNWKPSAFVYQRPKALTAY